MCRKMISTLFLLAVMGAASAQTLQLKAGGGFASQYTDSKVVGAFKIGVGFEYEFDQHWAINPSLNLMGKGWKDKDTFVNDLDENGVPKMDDEGNPIMSRMARSTTANYLELPVLMNYYIRTGESQYVVIGAGPYIACGLWGKEETKGDGREQGARKLYYDQDTFDKPGTHRFDAGIQTALGYQFSVGITLGVEADFGLTKFASKGGKNVSGLDFLTYNFGK